MVTLAAILVGIVLARVAGQRSPWLRAAVLAQAADLVTFAAVWEHGEGELNPLAALATQLANGIFDPAIGLAMPFTALLLGVVKLGLIAFLIRVERFQG